MAGHQSLEEALLATVDERGNVRTDHTASELQVNHQDVVGVAKSLAASEILELEQAQMKQLVLTEEAKRHLDCGSTYELEVYRAVPDNADGIPMEELKEHVKEGFDVGFRFAMQDELLSINKADGRKLVVRQAPEGEARGKDLWLLRAMEKVALGHSRLPQYEQQVLTKRKLVKEQKMVAFDCTKGPRFSRKRDKGNEHAELTSDLLTSGKWKNAAFKPYNLRAGAGADPGGGRLHPLLRVRDEFRRIFLEMGFEEMDTSRFVESALWNFDALVQPQQHPARDAHDTFYVSRPASMNRAPEKYVERVKQMHERGGKAFPFRQTRSIPF